MLLQASDGHDNILGGSQERNIQTFCLFHEHNSSHLQAPLLLVCAVEEVEISVFAGSYLDFY